MVGSGQHASVDPFTSMLPKASLAERLGGEVDHASVSGLPLSMLVVDIDYFKSINDAFGHARGDEILAEFARRLTAGVRRTDIVVRFGGDEFVVILPGTGNADALAVARRIMEKIRHLPFPGTPPLSLSLSIGVATYPDNAADADELFERADANAYEAKRRGRGQVVSECDDARPSNLRLQPLSRVIERDAQLNAVYEFLAGLPAVRRGSLSIVGPAGAGRSRLLDEADVAARLLGYHVIRLRGTPALRGRMFGALVEACPELGDAVRSGPRALAASLADRLRQLGQSVLLLAVDDLAYIDEAGRNFLEQLVTDPQLGDVGVICTSEWPLAEFGSAFEVALSSSVELSALSINGLHSWIRSAFQWEPPAEFLTWLHQESQGFPERIQRGLTRLLELSILRCASSGWELDPNYLQLSLGVWLDTSGRSSSSTLPPLLSSIIGRDQEIREIKTLLRTERLITLLGPGGFGKTRLAVQVAAELTGELEQDVCFVALAPLSAPEFVVPAIAEALRVSLQASRDPKQQLLDKLRGRQVLLVLDNFEHLMPSAALVSEILASAPMARVLVTSRSRLDVHGEAVYALRGISLPPTDDLESVRRSPATQLFVQRAERHNLEFRLTSGNAAEVAQICRTLEGGPLAIEIAASLVRLLDCAEILAEVRRDLDSLASTTREKPRRHRSLRAVFDYSWKLLAPAEQRVWVRLSVFHGGFQREAAEHVARATLPMLVVLANKSLLHRTEDGRFEVHETLRRYATEKLRELPEECEATEIRYARYFADFIYARGERGPDIDVTRLKQEAAEEIENIRAGFRWSVEHGYPSETEQYARGLFRFYDGCGWFAEGEELFRWAAAAVTDVRLHALILARRAYFLAKLGEYEGARSLHVLSLKALQKLGRLDDGTLSLSSLGHIASQQGDYARAERMYRKANRIFREMGSRFGLALCLNDMGIISLMQGNPTVAEQRFRKSLEIRYAIGDLPGQARCLNNLAMIADMQRRPREARSLFEQSLTVSRRSGDRQSVANALNNLGVLIRHGGLAEESRQLLQESRRFLEEALEVYEEIGADAGAALTLYNLGDIAYLLHDDNIAEDHFREALRRSVATGALPMLCTVFVGVASLMIRRGDAAGAARLLSLVEHHPAAPDNDRKRAVELLVGVAAQLPEREMEAIRASVVCSNPRDVALQMVNGRGFDRGPSVGPNGTGYPPFVEDVQATIEEGQLAERNARHTDARLCYETALRSLRTPEQAELAAPLLRWIGRTFAAEGDLCTAEDCLQASLAVAEARGELANVAHAVNLQGIVHFYRGDLEEAVRAYRSAHMTAEQAGELKLVAMLDLNLGVIANTRGDLSSALAHYEACLTGYRAVGMEENAIEVLNNMGMLYTDMQRWEHAEQAFEEALRLCERVGDLKIRIMVEVNRVELRIEQRNFEAARLACDSAFELATRTGHTRALGELHKHYGVIYRDTDHLYLADAHLGHAARIAEEHDNLLLAAETAREQAELYWRLKRNRETLQCLNRAHRAFFQLRARRDLAATDRRIDDFESFFLAIVREWGESIESADQYTQGHCERVADFACALARATGMDEKTLFWFRMGALLHDVGKIVVPPEVLNKPGRLDPEERAIIERHPDAGVELLAGIEFPWDVRPMVRYHHERWEGGGYPTGIAGEEIPPAARILCIADVYDALTSDRPYRAGFAHEKAIDIMENGMRGHFDPALFEVFKRIAMEAAHAGAGQPAAEPSREPVLQVA
jgi:diguanylate cyclase (GGDEF)-like protein/putative nucleotidyltransferase with HDIG domain